MLKSIVDVAAPAKLNLFLHIVGRRPDGYHLLQSVFVLIDWCDTLHFEHRPDGRLARHDLTQPLPADDLCLRAARALQLASGCTLGADISIDKQIPSGAGMGGGSSDAASTLLALNRLWKLHWPIDSLLPIALALGADVPFFLGGRDAWVEGIGEKMTPLALTPQWFAVVKPDAGIETRTLFAHPLVVRDSDAAILEGFRTCDGVKALDVQLFEGFGRNDLQAAAQSICADIQTASRYLESKFGNSRMTGSGSAVFARAGTGSAPVAEMTQATPGLPASWSIRMCRSLLKHPLAGW